MRLKGGKYLVDLGLIEYDGSSSPINVTLTDERLTKQLIEIQNIIGKSDLNETDLSKIIILNGITHDTDSEYGVKFSVNPHIEFAGDWGDGEFSSELYLQFEVGSLTITVTLISNQVNIGISN